LAYFAYVGTQRLGKRLGATMQRTFAESSARVAVRGWDAGVLLTLVGILCLCLHCAYSRGVGTPCSAALTHTAARACSERGVDAVVLFMLVFILDLCSTLRQL